MTAVQTRRMDLPEKLSVAALAAAALSLLVFGGVISAILLVIAAIMGWTRGIEANVARGNATASGFTRAVLAAVFVILAYLFLPTAEKATVGPFKSATATLRNEACPAGAQTTSIDFAVADEGTLRTAPEPKAAPVRMAVSNQQVDAPLEAGATVRQLCRAGDWSKVHVLTTLKEFQPLAGWVPASLLRKVAVTAQGRRIYEAEDFDWPAGSKPSRGALLTVMNRIMQDNPTCDALYSSNLVANKRGRQTVYSVPCWSGGNLRSFDFTAADAKNGRSFAPVTPVDENVAYVMCREAFTRSAGHPSTVDVESDGTFNDLGDGNTRYDLRASAKNGFGLQLAYAVSCDFRGDRITDIRAAEATD